MKKQLFIFVLPLVLAAGLAGCDNQDYTEKSPFDNSVYLDAAAETEAVTMSFNKTVRHSSQELSAVLAYPAENEVTITLAVDASKADSYNARHNTDYAVLDKAHYSLSTTRLAIPAGLVSSEVMHIDFSDLDQLEVDATYLLPITISDANIGIMQGSRTVYYLVRRSSAITVAANLGKDNYMSVPGFDTAEGCVWVNDMKAVTYEAIIYLDSFDPIPQETAGISSIMGVEQHCMLRIGDSSFTREQLQVEISGSNKIPGDDRSKRLKTGEWYHIAFTWNIATKEGRIYVNGKLQSEGKIGYGNPTIDLAMRGKDPVGNKDAYQFFIGHSYNDTRPLQGMISEVRIWNVVRTPDEIWKSMYDVDPQTEGLQAYWKFNEGQGNIVKDQTGHGNDVVSNIDLVWDNTIEIPMLNAE